MPRIPKWLSGGLGATVLAASALTGVMGASGPALAKGAPATVSVWSWRSQDAGMWQSVQNALRKAGVNVTIQFRSITATSYDSVLQTAMDGGKGPDLFYGRAGEGTFQYGASHLITPVNGLVSFKNFVPSSLSAVQYGGKDWGVPIDDETMEVFYNKSIFAKYHLKPPTTWKQFLGISKTLKSHNVIPIFTMPIQTWLLALNIEQIAASTLGDSGAKALVAGKFNFASPQYVKILTALTSLTPYFEPNFMAVGSAGNEEEVALGTGRAAMIMAGIYDVPTIVKYGGKLSNVGAFLMPSAKPGNKPMVDWYPDADLAMNSHITNPAVRAASLAIMRYATTPAFGQDFTGIAGEISPIKGVKIPAKYPMSVQAYKWYQTVAINPLIGIRSAMDTPPPTPLTSNSKTVNTDEGIFTAETNEIQALLSGKVTPAQAARAIQKAVAWYFKRK